MAMHSNLKKWDRMLDEGTVRGSMWDCFAQSGSDFWTEIVHVCCLHDIA